ncbi:MAG: beta-phosphoglucomutase family hydrolase [Candidatus Omnitrophota bacterium]|nr:MAG: beta-phosphoglucomutase family hydrolase [Candidatus Omnitrophota bacterium]
MNFKGAIFDLDGVIVDTVPLHFEAWKRMFSEYGKNFTFDDYKVKVDGIPRLDGARAILTDLNGEELQKAASKKQGYYLELIDKVKIKIYYSTLDLVKELKQNGIKVAAASSSRNCRLILERTNLAGLFDAIVGGSDFKKGKPDPEIFLLSASNLGLSADEVIVFEDAILGVEAAKNGRMLCVGIAREGDLRLLKKADIVVKDLSEVDYAKLKGLFKT